MSQLIVSEARSKRSRVNGARSHGPITEQGKQISSRNAAKHGLYSKNILSVNENEQEFIDLRQTLAGSLHPQNEAEEILISRLATAHWRLNRFLNMEAEIIDASFQQGENAETLLTANARPLNLLLRYISSAEREISRVLKDLKDHRKLTEQSPSLPKNKKSMKSAETNPRNAAPRESATTPADPDQAPLFESPGRNSETNPRTHSPNPGPQPIHIPQRGELTHDDCRSLSRRLF
jgi:hypothetical protein